MHPGREGTYTVYPPSSLGSRITFSFKFQVLPSVLNKVSHNSTRAAKPSAAAMGTARWGWRASSFAWAREDHELKVRIALESRSRN
jgi:hypothetical protein